MGRPQNLKLWRKKKNGKEGGPFYVTIGGDDVNLKTANANRATSRLPLAVKGQRKFESDAEAAARGMEPTASELGALPPPEPPRPDPPAASPPPPTPAAPIPPPPTPAAAAPIIAALLPPSPEAEAKAEADATNAAAAETGGAPAGGAPGAPRAPVSPDDVFSPDGLDSLLKQAAEMVVWSQFQLQAWIIKRRTGKLAPVPERGKLHEVAEDAWVMQFKRWFPDLETVAPWMVAVALPAMMMPAQMQHAKDPPPKPDAGAPPVPPPPTGGVGVE